MTNLFEKFGDLVDSAAAHHVNKYKKNTFKSVLEAYIADLGFMDTRWKTLKIGFVRMVVVVVVVVEGQREGDLFSCLLCMLLTLVLMALGWSALMEERGKVGIP